MPRNPHSRTNLMISARHAFLAIVSLGFLIPAKAGTQTFGFTGDVQSFVVPPYVSEITVTARGAEGGAGSSYGTPITPGLGGTTVATIAVTPGETLSIVVGGAGGAGGASNDPFFTIPPTAGAGGFNGGGAGALAAIFGSGGGGGASDVRQGGTGLANRVVVAGGGGGGYSNGLGAGGGNGGGASGQAGIDGTLAGSGGQGGGTTAGGSGGVGSNAGLAGVAGNGGDAGSGTTSAGGGGGGGYFGGGGGGGNPGAGGGGGGGGSSFAVATAKGVTMTQGDRSGDGEVILRWTEPRFGAAMKVRKQKDRAIFTLTNTGNTESTFRLSQSIKVSGAKLPKSALKIATTHAGKDISRGVSRGKATVVVAAGASARVVVKLKAGDTLGTAKRKVRIGMKASGHMASASAKTTLRVKALRR